MIPHHMLIYLMPQFDRGVKGPETIYSDRLIQWNNKKHNELCKKHFGNESQYWAGRSPEKIQSFLCDYCERNVLLCRVEQLENISNGNPYWRFDFMYLDKKDEGQQ